MTVSNLHQFITNKNKIMCLDEFTIGLYEEMEKKLEEISLHEINDLQCLKNASYTILQTISVLKDYISNNTFINKDEEINFFKNIKPKFLSKLIYYHKAFEILSHLPFSSSNEIKNFYLKEQEKISEYLNENKEFYSYYRSKSTLFDEVYFLRKEPESWLLLNFDDYETDLNFTTIYDYKLSKIIAFESLSELIKESINKVDLKQHIISGTGKKQKITWTASKVSLIELLYALQSTGACNNGTIDIKNLAIYLEHIFNIDLGNYYRVFQEIRIRKASRTNFLDQLKDRLIKRMDESDENPKRYF